MSQLPPPASFVPPRPGAWDIERTHMTRPVSGFMAEAFPRAILFARNPITARPTRP